MAVRPSWVERIGVLAIVVSLALVLWPAPPAFAAASVKVSLSVSPNPSPYEQEVEWRIHLTPSGPVTGYGIYLQPDRAFSWTFTHCSPDCAINSGPQIAGWGNLSFSSAIDLRGYGYAPQSGGAFSVTMMAVVTSNTPCGSSSCTPTATLSLPVSKLSIAASKTTVAPGETVHITQTATANVAMDLQTTSRLPTGLTDPTNVQPAGTWIASSRQMEWSKASATQLKVSYDTTVTASVGSSLKIQGFLGSSCQVCQVTLTLKVANPATAKPAPSPTPKPSASSRPATTPTPTRATTPPPASTATASATATPSAAATTASATPSATVAESALASATPSPSSTASDPAAPPVATGSATPSADASAAAAESDGLQWLPIAGVAVGTGVVATGGYFAGALFFRRRRLP